MSPGLRALLVVAVLGFGCVFTSRPQLPGNEGPDVFPGAFAGDASAASDSPTATGGADSGRLDDVDRDASASDAAAPCARPGRDGGDGGDGDASDAGDTESDAGDASDASDGSSAPCDPRAGDVAASAHGT